MATPDIGTTISDGYSKGFDRLASHAASIAVPALVVGAIVGAISQLQVQLVPDFGDMLSAALSGETIDVDGNDRVIVNALGALSSAIQVFATYAGIALFGGAFHRARKAGEGSEEDVPAPGATMPALFAAVSSLMPKLAILVVLSVAGTLAGIVSSALGGIVSLVAVVALVYFTVRWTYAAIVAGSGEATGDAAFERSESVVEGSWWGTLGTWIVISLATLLPVLIVGGIVSAVVPGSFASSLAMTTIVLMGTWSIYASALELGWAQVEGSHTGGPGMDDGGGFSLPPTTMPYPGSEPDAPSAPPSTPPAPVDPRVEPPTAGGDDEPHRGPFV